MSARRRVLHYAHQHGSGHVRHAANLVRTGAFDVTVVTAHPDAVALLPPGTPVVALPSDIVEGHVQREGSPLHYTPTGPVIQDRFAALLDAARRVRPDVCVVDVSVEAALFLRLAGFPVIHRRMPGERTDPAHELVYAASDHLVAHYGVPLEEPAWQGRHGARTTHLGVPDDDGRLGRRAAVTAAHAAGDAPRIGVITGTGGGGVPPEALARAAAAVPHALWDVYGPVRGLDEDTGRDVAGSGTPGEGRSLPGVPPTVRWHGFVPDAPARAAEADVVVVSAGHNASVDAARSGRPVVLAPEPRPFAEQECFAREAERAAGVPWCAWEDVEADWAGAIGRALADPAAADRLAAALLVPPAEYRARWEHAVETAIREAGGA